MPLPRYNFERQTVGSSKKGISAHGLAVAPAQQDVSHCVLMSDDLSIMPDARMCSEALVHSASNGADYFVEVSPGQSSMTLATTGWCNSWLIVRPSASLLSCSLSSSYGTSRGSDTLPTGYDEEGYREAYHGDSKCSTSKTRNRLAHIFFSTPIELYLGRSHDARLIPRECRGVDLPGSAFGTPTLSTDAFQRTAFKMITEQVSSPGWWFSAMVNLQLKVVVSCGGLS